MKDMHKLVKSVYKSRRGKGPKQGSVSVSKDNVKFNSTHVNQSVFISNREQSPLMEAFHNFNQSVFMRDSKSPQNIVNIRANTRT